MEPNQERLRNALVCPTISQQKSFIKNLIKMNKAVLIIGRFQPIHNGHLSLVKRYNKAGFFIKIGIGSSNRKEDIKNPLNIKEREEIITLAMKEIGIKKYRIYHIPDIKSDSHYISHVIKIVGAFDVLVTGNPWNLKLFRDYKKDNSWNIESFEEKTRPGGEINATTIRKLWLKKPSNKGLPNSVFKQLKKINFPDRLNNLK